MSSKTKNKHRPVMVDNPEVLEMLQEFSNWFGPMMKEDHRPFIRDLSKDQEAINDVLYTLMMIDVWRDTVKGKTGTMIAEIAKDFCTMMVEARHEHEN